MAPGNQMHRKQAKRQNATWHFEMPRGIYAAVGPCAINVHAESSACSAQHSMIACSLGSDPSAGSKTLRQ